MRGRRPFGDDRRAVAANVSHVLAIGIASLLIVTLLFSANSYLASQQETAVREGLEAVGSSIANELTMLDGLQASRTNVSMQASHPDRIAGSSYSVRIEHGPECDVATVTTRSCLVLQSATPELTEYVPLQNETTIDIVQGAQGRFRYVSTGSSEVQTRAGPDRAVGSLQPTFQLGIGQGVSDEEFGSTSGGITNVPPVATYRTDPSYPSVDSDITFTAYDNGVPGASDPDGDDSNLYYRWDFDGDGDWDRNGTGKQTTVSGTNPDYFDSPGVYNVTLNVTDRNGAGKSTYVSQNISVSGLVYNEDMRRRRVDCGFGCTAALTSFTMSNVWSSDVAVTSIYINVTSTSATYELEDGLSILGDTNYVESDSLTISPRGLIHPEGASIPDPPVIGTSPGTFRLREDIEYFGAARFNLPAGERIRIVVQHRVNGNTNATSFTDTIPRQP
ncbi:MAG: PKD domain-containing protein [Halorientalis sp.]